MVALRNASDTVVVELGSFESIQYNTTLARSITYSWPCLSTVYGHVFASCNLD
jgi:hypothetical protein